MTEEITPLILTYNEAPNIDRALQCLTWAKTIVVIDSFSTDRTVEILSSYPQVKLFQRRFDTHGNQWNYGLAQVQSKWVLSLDADYRIAEEMGAELIELSKNSCMDGYFARFRYCVFGRPLRGTLLPPRQVFFKKENASYIDDGHTQLLQIKGRSGLLSSYIDHDDRKSLSRWLWAQDRYMMIEAKKLLETPDRELSLGDRVRKLKLIAPFAILFYCLVLKGGILDGWAGWYYAFQRLLAETLLSIHLLESDRNHE